MGKKARDRRKKEKKAFGRVLLLQRWRQNEFGELQRRMTKAEARRRVVAKAVFFARAEREIIDQMTKIAHDEICAIEDQRVFADITRSVAQI